MRNQDSDALKAYLLGSISSGFLQWVVDETRPGVFLLFARDNQSDAIENLRLVRAETFGVVLANFSRLGYLLCDNAKRPFYWRLGLRYPGQLAAAERFFQTRIEDIYGTSDQTESAALNVSPLMHSY